MKYGISISIAVAGVLLSLQLASAQTLTDVLIGTTIDTGVNAENVRAMQGIKADARTEADALNAYQATLDAEMNDGASPARPPSGGTVSGGEVKVRTVVSVVPDTATRTPKAREAADLSQPINIVLSRDAASRQQAASSSGVSFGAIATDEDARTYATGVLRSDPAISMIAMTEGKTVIERRDTIELFWFIELDTTIQISVDQKAGKIDVDLPWWAKLAGKSEEARTLEALDQTALSRAILSTQRAESAARAVAVVAGAYADDAADGQYVTIEASGAVRFATSTPR